MFEKGDVYTIEGDAIRWVGVVTERYDSGNIRAIEVSYNKLTGMFIGLQADAYFNAERPGQRVLLTNPMNQSVTVFNQKV